MATNPLYSGPFYGPSDPSHRGPDSSPYIIALKRSLVRWTSGTGLLKWPLGGNFNASYNLALEHDVALFKAHKNIETPNYVWGQLAHDELKTAIRGGGAPKPHEPIEKAIDAVAVILMEDAYDLKHPGVRDTAKVHAVMTEYLEAMEQNAAIWHYREQRPMHSLGVAPSSGGSDDCSSLCVAACYWTRRQTDIFIPDPAGYGYSGYGNSVSLYVQNQSRKLSLSGSFEVGDIGLYGPYATRHAVICRKPGTTSTAIFTSHGSEAGPDPVRLLYRGDFFAAVRPKLVI